MSLGASERRPPGLRLQTRDVDILATLGIVSLLDTQTIHERFFPNDQTGEACRRRLRLLERHHLTQSFELALTRTRKKGRLPAVHRLTEQGAEVVAQETGQMPLRYARSDVPRQSQTVMHRLGMAKIILALNDACRTAGIERPDWVLEYDPIPGASVQAPMSRRFRLCFQFAQSTSLRHTCWADAACRLTIPTKDRSWHLAIFWEYDRSTETHEQVLGKLPGYARFSETKAYRQLWPDVDGVRVFFVVPSPGRRDNLITTLRDDPVAAVLRFGVVNELTSAQILTSPVWRTTEGDDRPIFVA